jgi:transcription-repair coupling factor (superfamily II helicase)
LLIPADIELTPIARRRLAALKEFSDLGAGFKIAALDLELRGAGNLLGGEQSGHIEAVGFDLYTQMLEQAVREMKGEAEPQPQAQLNLGLNIRIPADYIPQENQRLRVYKRIAGVETERQLADAEAELRDRYGEPPAPLQQLLKYAALRLQAMQVGVTGIERKRDLVSVKFRQDAAVDPARLAKFVSSHRGAQFLPDGTLKFVARGLGAEELLAQLQHLLADLFEKQGTPSVV